ncbi:hypothetical protein BCR33DRAFT_371158 [Rhizoclosmatium globosum]|uniref:Rho-GAP domain-containing protein n=1 Tax=Rhizoclosmatium globosum TaxID=329046 RepID=A0A1Y2BZH0_9FUNG|nr:hypothetical protein BCR33DRAFT_371158 [Rhizoclosmatium globosum]|eukprot:ORY40161.1 hypothetical protein BCR33DRAFT_371158 [Rhizoclosmatium globosum]
MIPRNTPNLSQSSTKAPSIVESPFNTILIKRNPHKSEHGSDSKSKSSLLSRSSKTLSLARSLFSGPSVRSHISENESASVHESKSSITSHSSNSSDSRSCQKPRHCSQRKPSSKKQLSSLLNAIISITQVGIQPKKSLPPTTKSREEEADGPIFNVTIEESASISCKNGIPDIVVQCVEYLERKQVLQTEGLYRVPGSQKRVN